MRDWIMVLLLLLGGIFSLIAAIGVVRMPDLFTRMQASTKSATLGSACILLAVALHFDAISVKLRALLIIGFIFLTAPIAAHMIGRAAYAGGVPLWKDSVLDELEGNYDRETHTSRPPAWLRKRVDDTAGDL